METCKASFIKFLIECRALRFGAFTLKSGITSPFFINLGHVSTGRQLEFLGKCFAATLKQGFPEATSLFGPAYKGISLASVLATSYWQEYRQDLSVFFDRKEAKSHGEGGTFIGRTPSETDRVVIVDDVMTDGATKVEAIKMIEATFGVRPVGVLVSVDRSKPGTRPGFEVCSIVSLGDIRDYLFETGDSNAQLVANFIEAQQ